MNGNASGTGTARGVLWQRVSFRAGKVRGETLVQAGPDSGRVYLPFPDESVDRVITMPDNSALRVMWSGTYELDEHRQMTLHIGKAVYFAQIAWRGAGQTMEFNQDIILTLPGAAAYRRAIGSRRD